MSIRVHDREAREERDAAERRLAERESWESLPTICGNCGMSVFKAIYDDEPARCAYCGELI